MTEHVLGLALKPHSQLDLDTDLNRALEYIQAKQLSRQWTKNCTNALEKFRTFLRQYRGQPDVSFSPRSLDSISYCAGFPDWLVDALNHYQRVMQRHWRLDHLNNRLLSFWNSHTRLWRWLFEHYLITEVADIKRQYILVWFPGKL